MKKGITLILLTLMGMGVWGQTNSANNENITGEWTFNGDRFYRDVPSSKQMSNIIKVDGVNKWLWRRLANSVDLRLYSYGVQKDVLTLQYGTGNVAIGNLSNYTDVRLTTQAQNATSTAFRSIGKIDVWGNKLDEGDVLATIRGFNYTVNSNAYLLKVGVAGGSNWEKFVIKGNGNVGIGTSSPEQSLSINTEQNKRALITVGAKGTADAGIYFDASNGDIKGADYGSLIQKDDLSIELNNYGDNPINVKTKGQTRLFIGGDGNIAIGKQSADAKLDVAGNIKAQEIEVTLANIDDMQLNGTLAANQITVTTNGQTADFVFEEDYELRDLQEVETFIQTNKHLPDIPSAAAMEENGVNLAEMNKLLLLKIEELTLYTIQKEKEVSGLKSQVESLDEARKALEERLAKIEALLITK